MQTSNIEALQIEQAAREVDDVSVEIDSASNKVILKGGLASIRQALSNVNVDMHSGLSFKPFTVEIEVEGETRSYSQKVHILYNPTSGSVVPMLKIGSNSPVDERDTHSSGVATNSLLSVSNDESSPFSASPTLSEQAQSSTSTTSTPSFTPVNVTLLTPTIPTPTPTPPVPTPPAPTPPAPTPPAPTPPAPPVNHAPTLGSNQADDAITAGNPLSLTIASHFSDSDGNTLTYTATLTGGGALPAWLNFNPATGVFSGTPANGDAGTISIDVRASDGSLQSAIDSFTLTVNASNSAPDLDSAQADLAANSGSAFTLDISGNFSDSDGDTLTYSAELSGGGALPAWLSFNTATGEFAGTPADGDAGDITVVVTADDGNGGTRNDSFVIDVNRLPTLDSAEADQLVNSGSAFALDISGNFSDADGDTLTYSAELSGGGALPAWLSYNATTGEFSGTPADGDAGDITVVVTADDGNATRNDTFVISVNRLPTLGSAQTDLVTNSGAALNLDISGNFSDADGDTLTYSAELSGGAGLPAWLSFNATTGVFSGTPADGDAGNITVVVTADDGNSTRSDTFVIDVNRLPTLGSAQADLVTNSGSAFNLDISTNFSDADGDTLTYSAELSGGGALPAWLSFNATTGEFSGTPADGDAGNITVVVTANDGNATRNDTFVIDVNRLPTLGSAQADRVANAGSAFSLNVSGNFSDADADTLTYSATLADGSALPSWLSINTTTGVFSGTPATGDAGTISVKVTANDGHATRDDTFDIRVNRPPTSTVIDTAAADVGTAYGILLNSHFTDADGDALVYTVTLADGSALPAWLSYDATNKAITGTPAAGDMGTLSVKVSVSDGNATAAEIFTLYVQDYTYYGASNADTNAGTAGADKMWAGEGNDSIGGAAGNDTIWGADGNDSLNGGTNNDVLYGGAGNDSVYGNNNEDLIYGDAGSDKLYGEAGNDTIYGGDDADTVDGGAGINVLYGDGGNDSVVASGSNNTMYGGDGNDVLDNSLGVGGRLYGEAGNDSIYGGSSQQSIEGGDGDDYITSQAQHDTIYGGAGNDTIYGGGHNDSLYGGDDNDTIYSGTENDRVEGNAGSDVLYGDAGSDTLYGGAGDDTLDGGADADVLYGEGGSNRLTGAAGNDWFVFTDASSSNTITDFKTSGSDSVRLSDGTFTFKSGDGAKNGVALTNGTDIFSAAGFAGGNFGAGGGATFLYDTTDGQLWYDADGNAGGGSAVLVLTIDNFGSYTYAAGDFLGIT